MENKQKGTPCPTCGGEWYPHKHSEPVSHQKPSHDDQISEFVRDITKVGWASKSDIRNRLTLLLDQAEALGYEKAMAVIPTFTDFPLAWKITPQIAANLHHPECSWVTAKMLCDCAGVAAIEPTLKEIKQLIKSKLTGK